MTIEEAAVTVVGALRQNGIPHMLVGALSSNYYGIPRNTKDADIVIDLPNRGALNALASSMGELFTLDPQLTFETITGNLRHIIRIEDTPFVVELFEMAEDPFQKERFRRRVEIFVPQLELAVTIPTAEDVIVQKLRWARPKDLEDARDVIAVQVGSLDFEYIERWCRELQIADRYETLRETLSGLD
jgi:hypothetical protein